MTQMIDGININYLRYGKLGAKTIVFLHGWGQNISMMQPIADPFQNDFDILIVDLPGFGNSDEPKTDYSVMEYVELLKKLFDLLKIEDLILVGHSFGGKISLLYASKYNVSKLILFGSPFKKEIEKVSIKVKTLKALKKVPGLNKLENFAKQHIGSRDYKNASPLMRKILVNTVNLDITSEVKKINAPTLIVWGTLDQEVPVNRAYELGELINDSGVVVYENCTHYAYLEQKNRTIQIMNSFLN